MTPEERLNTYLSREPEIHPDAFVHPRAYVEGAVTIAAQASVWPMAVLRGDIHTIAIGEGSNIQDGSVVHLADDYPAVVGAWTTVGHLALIHACTIGDRCLVGMHATLLDGVVVGDESIVGAHSLVTQRTEIPAGSLVLGSPARVVRELTEDERDGIRSWAEKYVHLSRAHRRRLETE